MTLSEPPAPSRIIEDVVAAIDADGGSGTLPPRGRADRGLALVSDRASGFEVAAGRLYSGPLETILLKMLAAPGVEIPESWLYFTAAVRRALPRHRSPRFHEIAAERPRLEAELCMVEPLVVVALGDVASQALWEDGAASPPGEWGEFECGDRVVPAFVTAHPRDALCAIPLRGDPAPGGKRRMYEDWQAISARFRHEVTREFGGSV